MTDAPAPSGKRPSLWGLLIPWLLFGLVVAGWWGYWLVLKNEAISRIEAAVADARAKGADAGYGRLTADGFPMRLSLRFADLRYAPSDKAWRVETTRATLHVNPTNLFHVIAAFDAPVTVTGRDGAAHVFAAPAAALSVSASPQGALRRVSLELEGLTIARVGEAEPGSAVANLIAHLRPDERGPGRYQLAIDADGVRLARPVPRFEAFGRDLAEAHLRGVLEAESPADLLAAVATRPLDIEGAGAKWGPASITATGRLGLDARRRPEGALQTTLEDPGPALAALGAPELAAAAPASGPVTLPLEARDGALFLGPVRLRELKPLY